MVEVENWVKAESKRISSLMAQSPLYRYIVTANHLGNRFPQRDAIELAVQKESTFTQPGLGGEKVSCEVYRRDLLDNPAIGGIDGRTLGEFVSRAGDSFKKVGAEPRKNIRLDGSTYVLGAQDDSRTLAITCTDTEGEVGGLVVKFEKPLIESDWTKSGNVKSITFVG